MYVYVCLSKIYMYPLCIYEDMPCMGMYIWHRCTWCACICMNLSYAYWEVGHVSMYVFIWRVDRFIHVNTGFN